MSDNTVARLTFNGNTIVAIEEDPAEHEIFFNFTPSEVPYGPTEEMPTNFNTIEFTNIISDYDGAMPSVQAELVASDWHWDEVDQQAIYKTDIKVGSILIGQGIVAPGDESPLLTNAIN